MQSKVKCQMKLPKSISAIASLFLLTFAVRHFGVVGTDQSLAAAQTQTPRLELKAKSVSPTQIQLEWRLLNGKASTPYLIYRAWPAAQNFVYINSAPASSLSTLFLDRDLSANTTYHYRIKTTIRGATTETVTSNTVTIVTPAAGNQPTPTPTPTPAPTPTPTIIQNPSPSQLSPATNPVTGIFVAPNGKPGNRGSKESPLDLATALAPKSPAKPGTTIWLRGGVYQGAFESSISGAAGAPITVRSYPGERATFDCVNGAQAMAMIIVNGSHTHFRDFEITCSDPDRTKPRPAGVSLFGPNTKLINLVIHDAGIGVGGWTPAIDAEIYGCLIYRNGWQLNEKDRGHGHGVYVQNDAGTKRVADNIVFDQYGYGVHAYTENGSIKGFHFDGNTIFGSGALAIPSGTYYPNILVGGFKPSERVTLTNNHLYHPLKGLVYNLQLFYVAKDNKDVTLRDNYIAGGSESIHIHEWQSVTATGNTFIGAIYLASVAPAAGYQPSAYVWNNNNYVSLNQVPAYTPFAFALNGNWVGYNFDSWRKATGFDKNGSYQQAPSGRPSGVEIFVRPNQYEAGRANIAVYNWDLKNQVEVDVSGALRNGDRFEVRDARNFYGPPVLSGVYDGKPLSLPMAGSPPAPEFGAFVVTKLSGTFPAPIPTPSATPSPKPSPKPTSTPIPTPTPTQNPAPTSTPNEPAIPLDSEERKLLDLINNYRFEKGLSPLGASISLTNASHWHSRDMSQLNYLNAIDSLGRAPARRARDFGFPGEPAPIEENALVAVDNPGFQNVFDVWRSAATNNSILLNPSWKVAGIARAFDQSANRWFWNVTFGAYWDKTIPLAGEDAEGRIDRNNLIRTRPPAESLSARHRFSGYGDDDSPYDPVHCDLDSAPRICWHDPPPQTNARLDEPSLPENLIGKWEVQYTISSQGVVHANLGAWDSAGFSIELQINPGGNWPGGNWPGGNWPSGNWPGGDWTMRGYRAFQTPQPIESGAWQSVHDSSRNEEIVTFTRRNGSPRATIRIHAARDQLTFFAVDGGGMMKNFLRGIAADDDRNDDPQVVFLPKYSSP